MNQKEVFLIQYQQDLQEDIQLLEKDIYELETFYLTRTKQYGNLFKGFQDYTAEKLLMVHQRKNVQIECSERLFSLSSVTSKASKQYNQLEDKPKEVQPPTMHRLRGRPANESRAFKDQETERRMLAQSTENPKQRQNLTNKERIKHWKILQKQKQQEETNMQEKTSARMIEEVHENSQPHKLPRK